MAKVEGEMHGQVLRQEHACVFAEQQRGQGSWKGVKEECVGPKGPGKSWERRRTLQAGSHCRALSRGAWPDVRPNRVTACVWRMW